jgi:hypothetical protein
VDNLVAKAKRMPVENLKTRDEIGESDANAAFRAFERLLSMAVQTPKEEMAQRIARDNAARTADRVQRGYKKRGPKPLTGI